MDWLAHSAKNGFPAQTYSDHVGRAMVEAERMAKDATEGLPQAKPFVDMVNLAIEYHDMGKMDDDNQQVLRAPTGNPLPRDHADAGVKHLFALGKTHRMSPFAGMLVYAHHRGLPDINQQKARDSKAWRGDENSKRFDPDAVIARTEACMAIYLDRHRSSLNRSTVPPASSETFKPKPLDLRFGLSCVADADHGDTARHYGNDLISPPPLRPSERLAMLDAYVAGLPTGESALERQRAEHRRALYNACRNADPHPPIYTCDSPVGSGKTTAVMAHLLNVAQTHGLRQIFVVQPFTNIIDQSVNTYRQALLLPGEQADQVVAAHHHRTDFSDPLTRNLTTLWQSPITVTTAVQFFETLATNNPSSLRKVHRVARSGIFIDEAHAALPAHLWPLAWQWIRHLAKNWGCHIVLASGSLAEFWALEDFYPESEQKQVPIKLPALANDTLQASLFKQETQRIRYHKHQDELGLDELLDFLESLPGPRIAVFNTVQTAAVVALEMAKRQGRDKVEHLSTALNSIDRAKTLARVKARLRQAHDKDWTLVATSLIEAGVDLSFRSGVREMASLASVLQLGGRVNRHYEWAEAEVWSVKLRPGQGLNQNRAMKIPSAILSDLHDKQQVSPDACTLALKREVRERDNANLVKKLFQAEQARKFPVVADQFKVIGSNTVTAITPGPFLDAIRQGARPDWKSIQNHSVQIWATRKIDFGLTEINGYPGLYAWNLDYDDFIGTMAGAMKVLEVKSGQTQII